MSKHYGILLAFRTRGLFIDIFFLHFFFASNDFLKKHVEAIAKGLRVLPSSRRWMHASVQGETLERAAGRPTGQAGREPQRSRGRSSRLAGQTGNVCPQQAATLQRLQPCGTEASSACCLATRSTLGRPGPLAAKHSSSPPTGCALSLVAFDLSGAPCDPEGEEAGQLAPALLPTASCCLVCKILVCCPVAHPQDVCRPPPPPSAACSQREHVCMARKCRLGLLPPYRWRAWPAAFAHGRQPRTSACSPTVLRD